MLKRPTAGLVPRLVRPLTLVSTTTHNSSHWWLTPVKDGYFWPFLANGDDDFCRLAQNGLRGTRCNFHHRETLLLFCPPSTSPLPEQRHDSVLGLLGAMAMAGRHHGGIHDGVQDLRRNPRGEDTNIFNDVFLRCS